MIILCINRFLLFHYIGKNNFRIFILEIRTKYYKIEMERKRFIIGWGLNMIIGILKKFC